MRRMHHLAHQGASALTRLQRFEHLIGKSGFASSLIRPTEPLAADCTNQEHRPWTSRTGCLLYTSRGRASYAISLSAPVSRMTDQRVAELRAPLMAARDEIARALGGGRF